MSRLGPDEYLAFKILSICINFYQLLRTKQLNLRNGSRYNVILTTHNTTAVFRIATELINLELKRLDKAMII